MATFSNEEKAKLYNDLLFKYQKISEQVRQIKAKNFEVSLEDQKHINLLESQMKRIFSDTQRLYS
jgi:hypothetical protein